MAASRGKLSLRRKNREPVTQPAVTGSSSTSTYASVGVAVETTSESSGGVERLGEGERGDYAEDFRPQSSSRTGVGRKRRQPQSETAGYMDVGSEDQLQLALAMSASLQPPSLQPEAGAPQGRKRPRKGRANEREPPPANVITVSAAERQRILAQRASAILQEAVASKEAIGGQAGQPSQLGQRVRESVSAKAATLWEMAGYAERDTLSKFMVPALDLLASETHFSPSPQPSPAPQAPSPPSQPPSSSLFPQHSPRKSPSQSQSSRSPQKSSQPHILHTAPSPHTLTPSPRPSSLPRGVKTLLTDLSSLVGSQLCSDVIITVEDGRGIPAHSAILACRCPSLAERLFHSLDKPVRLNFSQYSRATVVSFLRYLYTGSIPNATKAVKMLAMSLGMMEPPEEREEQHPLLRTHSSDSGSRVKETPSFSLSPSLARHQGSAGTSTPRGSPFTLRNETTPPPREAPPTSVSEVVATSPSEEVISVSSSPPDRQSPFPQSHSPPSREGGSQEDRFSYSSPLPLRERLSSRPHPLASAPLAEAAPTLPPKGSHDQANKSHDQASSEQPTAPMFVTPAPTGQRPVLESDTDITPMPDYGGMNTPHLKGECSRFGVRALPKKKMIAKLTEIYDYTHPLTDEDGNEVNVVAEKTKGGKGKKDSGTVREKPSLEELAAKVREVITKDTKLYEDMLLYKPLELTHIQSRLKAAAVSLSRDTLMDVLDHLCVTFSVPRQNQQQKTV